MKPCICGNTDWIRNLRNQKTWLLLRQILVMIVLFVSSGQNSTICRRFCSPSVPEGASPVISWAGSSFSSPIKALTCSISQTDHYFLTPQWTKCHLTSILLMFLLTQCSLIKITISRDCFYYLTSSVIHEVEKNL